MFLDWIECTIHGDISAILSALRGFFRPDWQELDFGGLGYNQSATVWDKGRVYWHTERADMGVHIRLPATALQASNRLAVTILCDLYRMGAKFTRIDLAADDLKGLLDMEVILAKVEQDDFVCRSRVVDQVRRLRGGAGNTLYFGSRASDTFFRIYDKAAEQAKKGVLFAGHWVRTEMELKHERAHEVAVYICENPETWGETARGWFLRFLDFKEHEEDQTKSRWDTCGWWSEYLENASKVRILICYQKKTIEDLKRWVIQQVAPSLYVLVDTIGFDEVFRLIGEASARLSPRQIELIKSYEKMLREMLADEQDTDDSGTRSDDSEDEKKTED
jgi:phage replication initiation protein